MCDDHRLHVSRRSLLRGSAAFGAMLTCGAVPAFAEVPTPPPNAISPDAALKRLQDGNRRYYNNKSRHKDFSADRLARADKQFPFACILSCSDSRVAPELVFDQPPGEIFVIRVAGNFVDEYGLASIEYGVKFLGTPLIMVLGHTGCGAVRAAMEVMDHKAELPGHLPALVDNIKPAVERAKAANPKDLYAAAVVENVRYNVEELKKAAPVVSRFVEEGKVKVVGGVYALKTGTISLV